MKITADPRSDQWNAEDFLGGPRTFTIAGVKAGTAEQKYDIELVEGEGRSWRPPLTVLRLLIAAWSDDASQWVGKRVTLYTDPTIPFGPNVVGGIRVSHLSGIDKPLTANLTVSRGKRSPITVQPLEDAPPAPDKTTAAHAAIRNATDNAALDKIAAHAASLGIDVVDAIDARKQELT